MSLASAGDADAAVADATADATLRAYGLPPAVETVLRAVRPGAGAVALDPGVDADRLVAVASANGLAPLFARAVGADPALSTAARDRLAARARTSAFEGLRLSAALVDVHARLDAAGVRALAYKGPTLAVRAFGDVASREFTDLDVLVDRRDLPAALAALTVAGFAVVTEAPPSPAEVAVGRGVVRPPAEYLLERADGVRVELRWRLGSAVRRLAVPFADLWERRGSVTVAGTPLPTLGDDDLALVCLRHGAKHCWNRLSWLVDVAALDERGALDWTAVLARAAQSGATRAVLLGALLAGDLAGAAVPSAVRERASADPRVRAAAAAVVDEFRTRPAAFPYDTDETRKRAVDRLLVDRRRDQVRTLVRQAIEPRAADVAAVPLPRPLYPAYYVVHPIRVGGLALRDAVRAVAATLAGRGRRRDGGR